MKPPRDRRIENDPARVREVAVPVPVDRFDPEREAHSRLRGLPREHRRGEVGGAARDGRVDDVDDVSAGIVLL